MRGCPAFPGYAAAALRNTICDLDVKGALDRVIVAQQIGEGIMFVKFDRMLFGRVAL